MIFILHAHSSAEKLNGCLGMQEHSSSFILNGFLPVLQELGQVVVVSDPETQVDVIYDGCRERGEGCVFLSFSPPHKAAVGLRCPTVCVFAWEFDRIPDEVWDGDRKNDWRNVFSDHGRAITLSKYAADVVRKTMGQDFPVAAIPIPLADTFEEFKRRKSDGPPVARTDITVSGVAIDSRNCRMTPDSMEWIEPAKSFHSQAWTGETIRLGFTQADECGAYLNGFYESESWGTWSATANPKVVLPYALNGNITLKIRALGCGHNVDKEIFVSLGDEKRPIRLLDHIAETCLSFQSVKTANILGFSGLDVTPIPRAYDCRTMGVGLYDIEISGDPGPDAKKDTEPQNVPAHEITLEGIVYTSVCDPLDDLKNWQDIVTAFCTAFQDVEDATLVLQIPHPSLSSLLNILYPFLQRLSPFDCRIVALHGNLDAVEYEKLKAAAHFYVNASRCEGLSVDLMEYMARGKPAIAPCHTAMADCVNSSSALIVDSCLEPCVWPHDTRKLFKTMRHRINWESLVQAYRRSYAIARREPDVYREMAESAWLQTTTCSSNIVVKKTLQHFFAKELGQSRG
jgi:glycosyltransferase involved in cell wall biosynthesis